jgi:hypothetical protein
LLAFLAQSSGEASNWDRLFEMPVVIFVVGGAIAISAIVATNLRGYHETKQLNRLKADRIDQGFAADEIARVVNSGPDASSKSDTRP